MNSTKTLATLALAGLVGLAACDRSDDAEIDAADAAGEQALLPQEEMDPGMMALMTEMQELQQQLGPIQQEAMQDETLAAQMEALQARLETAMRDEDAELFDRIDRFEGDMAEAQASGDQERLQAMMMEAQGIQQEVQALQATLLERPDIREPIEEFEAAHRARMIAIDPEAEAMLDRAEEIMEEFDEYQ